MHERHSPHKYYICMFCELYMFLNEMITMPYDRKKKHNFCDRKEKEIQSLKINGPL